MSWYWQWLLYIVFASAMFYGIFFGIPLVYQRIKPQMELKTEAEPENTVHNEEPVKVCPVCKKEMTKDSLNGVIVDQCTIHGIWFDKGELESIVNFVRTGGNVDGFFKALGVEE